MQFKNFLFVIGFVFFLTSCTQYSRTVPANSVGSTQRYTLHVGYIESITPVKVESTTGKIIGGIAGGGIGGVLGNTIGGGTGNSVATALGIGIGALVGAIAGDAVATPNANEILIRLNDGSYYAIVERADLQFNVGERVRLMLGQDYARIEPF